MRFRVNVWQWRQRLTPDSVHGHQTATEGNRQDQQGLKPPLGPCYDNQALFPTFGVSDYESLLVKLTEIDVQPHRDDLNKRAFVVWHQLPDELVVKAESFYREDWGSIDQSPSGLEHKDQVEARCNSVTPAYASTIANGTLHQRGTAYDPTMNASGRTKRRKRCADAPNNRTTPATIEKMFNIANPRSLSSTPHLDR